MSALSEDDLWSFTHRLTRSHPGGAALQRRLFDHVIFDHHAGILYRKEDGALYTFSADSNGPIQEKPFVATLRRKKNLWMAVWRLEPLRPGGYAPLAAERNEGRISIDNPPRFIQWMSSVPAAKSARMTGRRTPR
ncbi:hypothetical protein A7982_12039 [Minicystis rosea]|nr:hypothetical protein A7982_12039 [Minicystis rosea]